MNMLILCQSWQPELFNATFNNVMNTFWKPALKTSE